MTDSLVTDKPTGLSDPEKEGARAAGKHMGIQTNPYDANTSQYYFWLAGWYYKKSLAGKQKKRAKGRYLSGLYRKKARLA